MSVKWGKYEINLDGVSLGCDKILATDDDVKKFYAFLEKETRDTFKSLDMVRKKTYYLASKRYI